MTMSETGDRIGKYVIEDQLGRGGMGVVYKAHDTERNTDVAIKTIPPELAHHREFLRRFQQEARALMRLHHPHIVGLIDLCQDQGTHYMVLEYVDGPSLSQLLTKGHLPPERAREIASQVCDALSHAHEHNIVHRDIKPSNILLTKEGQVKVTDFGIARVLDATLGTLTGKVFGTARYASPEQIKGLKVDPRSDLYSLGVVLYEMLTGRAPFLGTDDEVMGQHVRAKPVPPQQWRAEIPEGLEAITLRCLEKDKELRHQTAEELATDLRSGEVSKKVLVQQVETLAERRRKFPLAVLGVVGLVLLIGAGLLVSALSPRMISGRPGGSPGATVQPGLSPSPRAAEATATGPMIPKAADTVAAEASSPSFPTPFVGKIAFLSDRDHRDVEPLNSWRPVELYIMNPDGSDQTRLTFGETPMSGVGARGNYPWVQRVSWHPAEDRIIVLLCAAPGMAAFFRPSDGQLDHTLDFSLYADGQTTLATSVDWSPDGKRVAYELNESLWVANSDGSERRQIVENISGYRPVWSPDGEWIAFSSGIPYDTSGLYVVRPDGTGLRHLTGGHRIGWKAWSPDGTRIAYEYWDPYDIVTVNVATGQGTNLTGPLHLTASHPTWSADGNQIAFQVGGSVNEIWIMNADGSDAHKIADGCCPAWQPAPPIPTSDATHTLEPLATTTAPAPPVVAPSGAGLIAFESDRDGNREIYTMKPDGTEQTRLTINPGIDTSPCWSAGGTRILFAAERAGEWSIYAMNPDGSGQTVYAGYKLCDSYLSPDGRLEVVFLERDGNTDIYLVNADGSIVSRLTDHPETDQAPSWSPDGTRIAFWAWRGANAEIFVMNADGTGQTNLTNNPARDANPCWSPDSTRIVFESDRDGNGEIYITNADRTGLTRLTNNPARDAQPSWSPG